MAIEWLQYFSLFFSAFLAATVFPAQSEVVLASYLALANQPWAMLITVATVGNVLGSITSWWLGRGLMRWKESTWFPFSASSLARGETWFQKFGVWTLLFSWLPLVGDALCVSAGALRIRLAIFVVLVAIGKLARYLFVAAVVWKVF